MAYLVSWVESYIDYKRFGNMIISDEIIPSKSSLLEQIKKTKNKHFFNTTITILGISAIPSSWEE